ncbi:MAG: carbamoyltransferase HypF [Verrucomicrobiales bacterium]|nr:carbamoyltransferase HypF [Verrucomicrobiales bacterium]
MTTVKRCDREPSPATGRLRLVIRGAVQGVGFRPFVHRLATELGLAGWVGNTSQGVIIEVEGSEAARDGFLRRLEAERPPRSAIHSLESTHLDPAGWRGFEIRASDPAGPKHALILPDIATCADCLAEIRDPANRRFRHPFTNCTNCGPRFSIIESLPYDRQNTSMRRFGMCARCTAEYHDPADRRFHAQPNACPECGPRLAWWHADGSVQAEGAAALAAAVQALRLGAIVAVKGLGGFHLMTLASSEEAVRRLRDRKRRGAKPFAVMAPSLKAIRRVCVVDPAEERLLRSPEAPIVLLRRLPGASGEGLAASLAPGNPWLGVMLPYTPLHHLLLADVGDWLVATSGNLADEPICVDEHEARERLEGIADWYLVHDRPIVRHGDDSIVRVVLGREMVLRRARGLAPLPVLVGECLPPSIGFGAHLKNTVALGRDNQVFLSQHIGDLESPTAMAAFDRVIRDLTELLDIQPQLAASDMHPDYLSSQRAATSCLPTVCVQHHYAHVLACMAENSVPAPLLGVSWDGAGLGADGSVWGGEFLLVKPDAVVRAGCLRSFRLPGGDAAAVEPRRSALGLLHECYGAALSDQAQLASLRAFSQTERDLLLQALESGVNAPKTTSAGRLFDGVASILDLRHVSQFEGQAAMELEFAIEPDDSDDEYPFELITRPTVGPGANGIPVPCPEHDRCHAFALAQETVIVDWGPTLEAILGDLRDGASVWSVSARFHNTLAEMILAVADRLGEPRVLLTGGCFQNRYLLERTVIRLKSKGFTPYWHQRVPPNDGGIALGQVLGAIREQRRSNPPPPAE